MNERSLEPRVATAGYLPASSDPRESGSPPAVRRVPQRGVTESQDVVREWLPGGATADA